MAQRNLAIGIDFGIDYGKMDKADAKVQELKQNVRQAEGVLGTMGATAKLTGYQLQQAFKTGLATLEKYKYELLGAFTAMSTAMYNIGKAGAEFDYQVRRTGLVAEATADEVAKLSQEARQLGIDTRFTASQAAAGQEMLARMGFEVDEVIGALPGILDMAAASDMELADASRIVAKSLNTMRYEAEDAVRVADVLLKASTSAGANVAQLGTAFTEVAGEAEGVGWEIEEMTAALGLLADRGETGTRAGRRFRSVIQDLLSPTAQMTEEMNKLGIELWDDENNFKSLTGVVKEFEMGLEGLSLQERQRSLSNMFTKRGLAVFRKILSAGSDELTDFEQKLIDSGGTAQMMAEEQMDTLIGAFKELKGSINVAAINMSLTFIPMMKNFVQSVKDGVNVFNELPPMTQGLVGSIGLATTIVLGLATAFAFLRRPVMAVWGVFKWIGSSTIFKTIVGGLGLTAGKVAILAGLVIGLYFAFEDLYLSIEHGYDGVLLPLIDSFLDFIGVGWDFIEVWNRVEFFFIDLWANVKLLGSGLWTLTKGFGELIWALVNFDAEGVLEAFGSIGDGLAEMSTPFYTIGELLIGALFDGIIGLLDLKGALLYTLFTMTIEKVWNDLIVEVASWVGIELPELKFLDYDEAKEKIYNTTVDLWEGTKAAFWAIFNMQDLMIEILDFSLEGEGILSGIKDDLDNWWDDIVSWFDEKFNIKSIIEDKFDFDWSSLVPDWAQKFIPGIDTGTEEKSNNVKTSPTAAASGKKQEYKYTITGGMQPVNNTTSTTKQALNEQRNEFNITIDNSNGNDEDLLLKIRRTLQDEFTKGRLAETGGI